MMHGREKSDLAIRAKKPANKAGPPAAEWAEQRAGTEGNTGQPRTRRTQSRESVSQGLGRVRYAARRRKKEKFTALWHHIYNPNRLHEVYWAVNRSSAASSGTNSGLANSQARPVFNACANNTCASSRSAGPPPSRCLAWSSNVLTVMSGIRVRTASSPR